MENWQVALIVILAIFVGVLIPSVVQFQMTMRSIHRFVRNNETDVRVAMVELKRLAAHVNRVGSIVESNTKQIESFFSSLEGVGHSIRRIRGAMRTASLLGAAVGPALAAAVKVRQDGTVELAPREQKLNGATKGEERMQ
jgi:uncharacterized protein YoxC